MKLNKLHLLFVMIFALLMAGCAPANTAITAQDGLGQEVKLASPAQRIISLAPSNTEILFAIGAGEQVVGRDDFSDFPSGVLDIKSVGGNPYNMEEIVGLKPDLVLLAEINTPELAEQLKGLGIATYYVKNPTDFVGLYQNIETLGNLTGHAAEAKALTKSLAERVDAVNARLALVKARPIVYYELDASDPAKPWTVGPGTFIHMLLEQAKAQNFTVVSGVADAYPQISIEQVVMVDPDFIVLGDAAWGVTVESVGQRPGWQELSAVTQGKVVPFDDNLVSRPGPRLVDALEQLAELLHP